MPIYPLYALLFADTGLSDAEISVLFALWSAVGIVAEVPSGALADRFGRRPSLAVGALVQAVGYASWVVFPGFLGFAVGFVAWGLGSALASGAQEALLHDGLASVDAAEHYARVQGWVGAAGLIVQVPTAGIATVLFVVGGYPAAGWVSVATCVGTAVLAARLPEPSGAPTVTSSSIDPADPGNDADASYLATLRAGVVEVVARPPLLGAVVAFGLLYGLDAFEEYFPLLARDLQVSTAAVPTALLVIPLVGAVGAALGGPANRLGAGALGVVLAVGAALLGIAAAVPHPVALAAVALYYGLYRAVLVVADARLQERITGPARATVTSVANVVGELPSFAVYAAWALGGTAAVTVLVALTAALLPVLLRWRTRADEPGNPR
ncbi:MFS transporter [Pseudonocardia charpentierae]|uniref:MFS transporter n=1 Tax=Pseudonocardia charpentierae TaxID=3075545 RepID=A0ABU2N4C9_9PSEU|nr:MFS transporter [Pseudonocardia sp. DSM 45834]MDT0348462.1 MFS transporter [Pseudonocardia sp. DSM 45834]